MNKKNKSFLTEKLIYDYKILTPKDSLKKIVLLYTQDCDITALKTNTVYSLVKSLGNIPIEIGEFIIKKTTIKSILELLNSCVEDSDFDVAQDFNVVHKWAKDSKVELPDKELCEGYIINNELINFYREDNATILQFKYKTKEQSSFILFKLYFFKIQNIYFVFQCRYF